MYKPDHVDGDQYGQERHPRDRDVTSANPDELEAVSVERFARRGGLMSMPVTSAGVRLVLVVPLVSRQLAACVGRQPGPRHLVG